MDCNLPNFSTMDSQAEYRSELLFPSPRIFSEPRDQKPQVSSTLQANFLPSESPRKPYSYRINIDFKFTGIKMWISLESHYSTSHKFQVPDLPIYSIPFSTCGNKVRYSSSCLFISMYSATIGLIVLY